MPPKRVPPKKRVSKRVPPKKKSAVLKGVPSKKKAVKLQLEIIPLFVMDQIPDDGSGSLKVGTLIEIKQNMLMLNQRLPTGETIKQLIDKSFNNIKNIVKTDKITKIYWNASIDNGKLSIATSKFIIGLTVKNYIIRRITALKI